MSVSPYHIGDTPLNSSLMRQVIVVPLGAMLVAILSGIALPGYSSVSQHISEMTLIDRPAALITRTAFVVTAFAPAQSRDAS